MIISGDNSNYIESGDFSTIILDNISDVSNTSTSIKSANDNSFILRNITNNLIFSYTYNNVNDSPNDIYSLDSDKSVTLPYHDNYILRIVNVDRNETVLYASISANNNKVVLSEQSDIYDKNRKKFVESDIFIKTSDYPGLTQILINDKNSF
jgi:hypothetical protein